MGAVGFPMAQLPMPNFRFYGLRGADKASRENVPQSRADAAESGTSSTGGLTVSNWGTYSLSSIGLSASNLQAQISDGGMQASLQSTQLELNANAMTLRSEDGQIEFSMTSLSMRASQLSFSFAQEQRAERLSEFAQRMDDLAARLGPPSTSRLAVSAQALSLRFSQSAIISETALNGFEKGATMFSKQSSALFTQFLVLFRTLLESSDEEATEFLEALNEFLEIFGFATGEDGYEPVDVEAAVNSALPEEAGASVQAFFEQIEITYTRVEVSAQSGQQQEADPLVLDLDGDGVELTDAARGQRFDISGSGTPVLMPFPAAGDAFLAVDRNANGTIDSGKELFGDQNGAAHGFAELAKYDQNLDGMINVQDAIFEQLLLFGDLDEDGDVRPDEFISLSRAGISAIDLRYEEVTRQLSDGNRITQSSRFIRNDGSTGEAADVVLRTFSALA